MKLNTILAIIIVLLLFLSFLIWIIITVMTLYVDPYLFLESLISGGIIYGFWALVVYRLYNSQKIK
jgi:hypothetical protein